MLGIVYDNTLSVNTLEQCLLWFMITRAHTSGQHVGPMIVLVYDYTRTYVDEMGAVFARFLMFPHYLSSQSQDTLPISETRKHLFRARSVLRNTTRLPIDASSGFPPYSRSHR